jgi:hypothetical protein
MKTDHLKIEQYDWKDRINSEMKSWKEEMFKKIE